jgi:hypothetical protein
MVPPSVAIQTMDYLTSMREWGACVRREHAGGVKPSLNVLVRGSITPRGQATLNAVLW